MRSSVTPLPRTDNGIAAEVVADLALSSLDVQLRTRPLMGIWTRFRRRIRALVPLPTPSVAWEDAGIARFELRAAEPGHHVRLQLPLRAGEHIVGFGERFNAVDQRGWTLESYSEEGAVGLGERLSPLLTRLGVSWNPWPKGPTTTYKPLPWWLSSRGYGVLLETFAPAFFDVGATNSDQLIADVASDHVRVTVIDGATPAEIVERMTALSGRPPRLPDWALAPWLDALGGATRVREVAALVRDHRIPCSAIWAEDWHGYRPRPFGDRKWSYDSIEPVLREPDPTHYPDLPGLAGELHDRGFRFLGYYFPYVHTVDPMFDWAAERGYLLRDRRGRVRTFKMLFERVAQVDLTNPDARDWYRDELRRGLDLGFDGWMADFGEYTPVDAVTGDGEDGLSHHNRYPLLWAELNRDAIEASGRRGDAIFFSRSAAPGQQAVSPLFWTGDSNTDFERWDGLPSNLRGLLSAGLSGISLYTVDIGGYMSVVTRARDREVLARWAELGALLVVMRTHHGTHTRRSVQFDHDADTLAHFARCARLHAALFPLRRALADDACRTGLPVARSLLLVFPDDPRAWQIEDQFMLGTSLLVAPVVERGARARDVYLPGNGVWIDLWTGQRQPGSQTVRTDAPLGRIPLFLRADALLPTFDRTVDTFARRREVGDLALSTLDDAERSLSLLVGSDVTGEHALYDGTRIAVRTTHAAAPSPPAPRPHELLPDDLMAAWRPVGAVHGDGGPIHLGDGRELVISSPQPRTVTVYLPRPDSHGPFDDPAHSQA